MILGLILGILIGGGVIALIALQKQGKLTVKWYQWVLAVIAIVLALLAIQNIIAFGNELEPTAQRFVFLAMGLPAIFFGVLAVFMPTIIVRNKTIKD